VEHQHHFRVEENVRHHHPQRSHRSHHRCVLLDRNCVRTIEPWLVYQKKPTKRSFGRDYPQRPHPSHHRCVLLIRDQVHAIEPLLVFQETKHSLDEAIVDLDSSLENFRFGLNRRPIFANHFRPLFAFHAQKKLHGDGSLQKLAAAIRSVWFRLGYA
jgi:hypothetical protein